MNISILLTATENLPWIFDGLGTEIISLIIGGILGGFAGYKIGSRNRIKQKQKAGDGSIQNQVGSVTVNNEKK